MPGLDRVEKSVEQIIAIGEQIRNSTPDDLVFESRSIMDRQRSAEKSPDLFARAFALCGEAVRRATGIEPSKGAMSSAVMAAIGVLPRVTDDKHRTIAIALAAYWYRSNGVHVHIVAADDRRSAALYNFISPILAVLGGSVGLLTDDIAEEARRSAYRSTITVGSYIQFASDYLRDNLQDLYADTVQLGHGTAIVDDADMVLAGLALERVVMTAPQPQFSSESSLVTEAVDHLRPGVDYKRSPERDAIVFERSGIVQVLRAAGWQGDPSMDAVTHADRQERAILGREGILSGNARQFTAEITVQGYIRLYEAITGVASRRVPAGPVLKRVYGLDARGLAGSAWAHAFGRREGMRLDERALTFERIVDEQRSWIYSLRADTRDAPNAQELIESLATEAARCWPTLSFADAIAGLHPHLADFRTFEHFDETRLDAASYGELRVLVAQFVEQVLTERRERLGEPSMLELSRNARLAVLDIEWREHLLRASFLRRHAEAIYEADVERQKRDLRSLFDLTRLKIAKDSVEYALNAQL